jgi:serine/threonine protein kinase
MTLTAGARLGPYEITGALGAGGMGEVYRAHDSKLGRDVAIKVLPLTSASDLERLARLEREARLLAALNHPNIAQIYGLEESGGPALVMELVEGETLADRIARGPIPLAEALLIARQIAEALAAAHEQGIIHRDLKPANVKVRPDGSVKVLDFGLAKWTEPTAAADVMNSPTLSARSTLQGVILGTAAYMSPEQAAGQRVDRRTDLWSFGVVLFEMLTGRRAFEGESVSHVLAAVLKSEPDWSAVAREVPPSVQRLLRRCLTKDPRTRLDSATAARLDIAAADDSSSSGRSGVAFAGSRRSPAASQYSPLRLPARAGCCRMKPPNGSSRGWTWRRHRRTIPPCSHCRPTDGRSRSRRSTKAEFQRLKLQLKLTPIEANPGSVPSSGGNLLSIFRAVGRLRKRRQDLLRRGR